MYLRCWRTKNPFNSKNSRTMISLTAAIPPHLQDASNVHFADFLTWNDLADALCQDKIDLAVGDLFIESHRLDQFPKLWSRDADVHGQARLFENRPNTHQLIVRQANVPTGEGSGGHLSD